MKKIDVSQIVDPSIQQPFTGLSLAFLQEANKEMIYAVCRNIIVSHGHTFSATTPYFISADNYGGITGDGYVFYGNELYRTSENVAGYDYAIVDTTPDSVADPVLFTDSVNRNVHGNRYITYTLTASGALYNVNDVINAFTNVKVAAEYVLPTQTSTSYTYANLTGLAYTTTKAAKYEIELKGTIYINSTSGSGSAGGGALFRLFNTTDLASLDDSRITINTIATGTVDSVICVSFQCKTISYLASGKTIDSQFAMETGTDDITALNCKMFVKEL
jgi:hypothetical protein